MKGIVSMLIAGSCAANFGLTGLNHQDSAEQQQQQVDAAYEQTVPRIDDMVPASMTTTVRSDIQGEVNAGVRQLDRSVRQVPRFAVKVAQSVEEHGIAALAYSTPELQDHGRALGGEIGQGIRHFAVALKRDLILSVNESGLHAR